MLKTVSSITNAIGALNFKGTWNASTNTPTLTSGVGVKGDYFVVNTAGTTNLDGISTWGIGDWATYNGTVWQRVEGGADLEGVNLNVSGTTNLSALTASTALALDANKNVVSVPNTGTGNNVLATAPTFAGDVTLSTGNIIISTAGKGIVASNSVAVVNTAATTTGDVTLTNNQLLASPTGGVFNLGKLFATQTFRKDNATSITITTNRQSGLLMFGATWVNSANSTLGGVYHIVCGGDGVSVALVSQQNRGGFGNATVTTSGFNITITMPSGASANISGCFVGTAVA